MGREVGVTRLDRRSNRRSWISKDGGGVRPIQEEVEDDAKGGGKQACRPRKRQQGILAVMAVQMFSLVHLSKPEKKPKLASTETAHVDRP